MKVYRVKATFFCAPLKRYLPVGALLGRYENAVRLVIQNAPRSDQDLFTTLVDGIVYDSPKQASWLYGIEPPPLGNDTRFMTLVASKSEDGFGNVGNATSDGLPVNSEFRVQMSTGQAYMFNPVTGLYYHFRLRGEAGSVYMEVGQVGVPKEDLNGV